MATIASLAVNLIAQTGRFTQPLKAAERAVQSFQGSLDKVSNNLQRLQDATNKASVRLLAMKAAATIATHQATQYAGAVVAVHQQTGILIESVQGLRFAAEQSSTDIKTLEVGLRSLARRSAEAALGNTSFAKGFERLGVNVVDANGNLKDMETILMEVADGAAKMASEAEVSAALMTVMGDAGRRLVPFMRQGSDGIRALMDEARRLGIVMDENAIRTLDALGAEIQITGDRIGAMSRDLAYRLAPAVSVVVGWFNALIDRFFALSAEQRQQIVRWSVYAGMILGAVAAIGVLARVLVSGVGILRSFGTALSFVFSPMVLYIGAALLAIGAFKAAWETDWHGIKTAAETVWEDHLKPIWEVLKEPLKTAWEWAVDIVGTAWEWIVDTTWAEKLEDIKGWLTTGWEWVVDIAGDAWDWLTETTWSEKVEDVKNLFEPIWNWTLNLLGEAWAWIEDNLPWVATTVETLRDWLSTAWDWTINLVGDAWEWLKEATPDSLKNLGTAALRLTIEPFGELYSAIKTGLETGDWSGIWGVAAEAWRTGIKIAVSLALAGGTAQMVLNGIRAGLGLLSAGAASVGALGMPGVLGVLSIGVALAEAMEGGDYQAFGDNLIAALAAGIGIGSFTGSPYLGALAFTIVLNFRVGEWIGDKLKEIDQSRFMRGVRGILGTGPTYEGLALQQMASGEYMTFADRETYLMPAPEKRSLTERIAIWWQNTELARWLSGDAPGSYQTGTPWTGWGPLDEVAGVVHRREAVIPWEALRKGPAGVLEFLGVPGFQDGRGEGILRSSIESARPALEALRPGLADTLLDALDMLSEGVGWLKEHFDELMKAIEDGPQAIDDAINSIRDYAEELELAAMQQAAVNTFVAQILGKMPILSQMLQGMHAGALFGPAGSAVGALAALALHADTTAHGFRMVNETLQALANAVGMLLQPLLPLIYVVQTVLVPIFSVLGQVLSSVLLPIMPFVFEAFRVVGIAVLLVAEMFQRARAFILDAVGGLVWGIGKFVDSLIGWLTGVGRDLMRVGDSLRQSADDARKSAEELADSRRDLIDLTYDEAMKRAQLTDEIERAVGGMINIPQGFRYALERMEAATPKPAPAGLVPTPTPAVVPGTPDISASAGLTGGGRVIQVHYHLHGDVYGWEDFKRKVQQADAEIRRDLGLSLHGFAGGNV